MVNSDGADLIWAGLGGMIIGLATTLNLLTYGRITGNSGIFNTLITLKWKEGFRWKFSFFSGMIAVSALMYWASDEGKWDTGPFTIRVFDPIEIAVKDLHVAGWIIGGFLVGLGTKLGNGCTSGHGVCGLPRLSKRSIVAVCLFMGWAISLATFRHYITFFESTNSFGDGFEDAWPIVGGSLAIALLVAFWIYMTIVIVKATTKEEKLEMPISWIIGAIFGFGLTLSGMCRRTKINGFLTLYEDWDPSLMLVMAGAVGVNIFTFPYIIHKKKTPVYAPELCLPKNKNLDARLIIGASLFGLGWGLSSLCPGPAMIDFFNMTHWIVYIPSLMLGHYAVEIVDYIIKIRQEKKVDVPHEDGKKTNP